MERERADVIHQAQTLQEQARNTKACWRFDMKSMRTPQPVRIAVRGISRCLLFLPVYYFHAHEVPLKTALDLSAIIS